MSNRSQVKFVKDVEAADRNIRVKKPFKLEQQEQRRFVRLEISSPMSLDTIRDLAGNFWPEGNKHYINGIVLNISAGGVLAEIDEQIHEGDVVAMRFTIQDVESLDNVLGLVKRADYDDGAYLVGIEFVSRERLADIFTRGEIEMLSNKLTDFSEGIRSVLNRYIHQENVAGRISVGHEPR